MATTILTITHNETAGTFAALVNAPDFYTFIQRFMGWLNALRGGAKNGAIAAKIGTAAASIAITINNSNIAANDLVTIGGTTITCKASGATTGQFNKGSDATETAANMAAAINGVTALAAVVTATSALGVVTITCDVGGTIGNYITVAKTEVTPSSFTFTGTTLAGGSNGTTASFSAGA
jgi:phage tail sheath gpL-like